MTDNLASTRSSTRVSTNQFGTALRTMLAEYPDAFVAALGDDGIFVPVPDAVPLRGHRVLQVRSTLELVVPDDREIVLTTWQRARTSGAATAQLHLRLDPDRSSVIHYFDVRDMYGVYIAVLVGADGSALPEIDAVPARPPRVARVRKNELAVFSEIDAATTALLGWTSDEMVDRRSLEFIHPDDGDRAIASWMQMLSEPARPQPGVRMRHRHKNGSWVWFEVTNQNHLDDPAGAHVLAEMVDISDEMAAHEALQAREQLLHRLAEALPIGVFEVLADGRVTYTNERLQQILGLGPAATVEDQLATVSAEDRPGVQAAVQAALHDGIDADLEIQVRPPEGGRARRCTLRLRTLTDAIGAISGAVVCVEDVTESAQLRAELERRASHDMLTRLLNRASVIAALDAALTSRGTGTAVVFVDLDDFKGINDRLGHVAGDEVLSVVADRLGISVRGGDPVGRIGGDEFLVVCPSVESSETAIAIAERIAYALRQPVRLAGTAVPLRASVGVAYSRRRVRADVLVRRADTAMYESKRRAEGAPVLYSKGVAATRTGATQRPVADEGAS
ncbi:MAG: diguanylate cyclase domain-containing protein [Candidatus Limnocylindrales bacterium]